MDVLVSEPSSTSEVAVAEHCAECGEDLVTGAGFCEACGAPTGQPAAVPAAAPPTSPDPDELGAPATPAPARACERCSAEVGPDDYCTGCGVRSLGPVLVDDRGRSAFATHRGVRHPRNEDAAALATTAEGWPVLVVADGVSASPNPHLAAAAAVQAAVARLGGRAFDDPAAAIAAAVADAHAAACAVPADTDPSWPADGSHPACTIVVAVATPDALHLANVGDARGYAIRRDGAGALRSEQLTTDDSVAAKAVAEGIPIDQALQIPGGHAITGWLGADAPTPAPHLATSAVGTDDLLLVCSDGLWNYAPTGDELDALLATVVETTTGAGWMGPTCERLVRWSIDQGGADNICVALTPISQEDPT